MTDLQTTLAPDTSATANTPLSINDRCDSCGAQAYVRATIPSGVLLFCGHHGAKHKEQLLSQATAWHDETFRLLPSEPGKDIS